MSRVTKQDLQNNLKNAEAEITSLRDELSQASLSIGDLESELQRARSQTEQRSSQEGALLEALDFAEGLNEVKDGQIEALLLNVVGFANILKYTGDILMAIRSYKGPNPDRPKDLANMILEDTVDALVEINEGKFGEDALRGILASEQEAVAIATSEPDFVIDPSLDNPFVGSDFEKIFEGGLSEIFQTFGIEHIATSAA